MPYQTPEQCAVEIIAHVNSRNHAAILPLLKDIIHKEYEHEKELYSGVRGGDEAAIVDALRNVMDFFDQVQKELADEWGLPELLSPDEKEPTHG